MNLAARGARNMDNGIESIEDETAQKQVRKQANRVLLKSAVLGALLTLVFVFIPELTNLAK